MNATNKVSSNIDQEDEFSDNADQYTLLTKPLEELRHLEIDLDSFLEQYAQLPSPSRELFYANEVYSEMYHGVGAANIFGQFAGWYFPEAISGFLLIGMTKTALVLEAMALTLGEPYPRDLLERCRAHVHYMDDNDLLFQRLADRASFLFRTENGGFEACANRYAQSWLNNKAYMKRLLKCVEKSRMARPLYIHMLYASAGPLFATYNANICLLSYDDEIKKYLAKVPQPLKPVFLCTITLFALRQRGFDFLFESVANYVPDTVIALKQLGLNDLATLFETMINPIQPYSTVLSKRTEQILALDKKTQSNLNLQSCKYQNAIIKMMPQFEQVVNELSVKIFKDNPKLYPGVKARITA